MTPERSQSPVELSNSEGDPTAPSSSTSGQIRVKNVSEINLNEADAIPPTKRKSPSWLSLGSSSSSKKTRTDATENDHLQEEHANGQHSESDQCTNGEADVSEETVDNGDSVQVDAVNPESSHCNSDSVQLDAVSPESSNCNGDTVQLDAVNPESSHCSTNPSISNEPICDSAEGVLTTSASTPNELAQNVLEEEPSGSNTNEPSCSSDQKPLKKEPTDNDEDCKEAVGQIVLASPRNIKPAIKVEKEEATSSTSRNSCRYGIRCYRRNPMHRIEEAHPGDKDYKRPDFPTPPDGTPPCPYGDACYRRNPTHFQQFSHPPSTDFEQNWKDYKLRLRQRQRPPVNDANSSYSDLDDDDYDLLDPFINDSDDDEDFIPSDLDDERENDFSEEF